jgi:uncharacterized protein YndB with AHSA1/START domain
MAMSAAAQDFWSTGTYKEIVPLQKLVASDSFADSEGNVVSPVKYGMPADMPEELEVTLTFEELPGGRTHMTLRHDGMPEGQMQELAGTGWNESFDKLAQALTNWEPGGRAGQRIVPHLWFDAEAEVARAPWREGS